MANPTLSCIPSRLSGVAPLGVIFDCTGTTDDDSSVSPFRDLLYRHDFGDFVEGSAGKWAYGANTNMSRNTDSGPIAAHVFESPGTYTVRSEVTDGVTVSRTTTTIVVSDPDEVYAGLNTVCLSLDGDFTDAPEGALEITLTETTKAISGASNAADTITVIGHGYTTGQAVRASNVLGTLPTGITSGALYYINSLSADTLSAHTTYDAAIAGTPKVAITSDVGSGGFVTGVYETEVSTYAIGGKRVLLRRGEEHPAIAIWAKVNTDGAITIGTYGSGAKPIINLTPGIGGLQVSNSAIDDLRIMDISFVSDTADSVTGVGIQFGSSSNGISNITVLRVEKHYGGIMFNNSGGGHVIANNVIVQDCLSYSATGVFGSMKVGAIMGNTFGPVNPLGTGEHPLRLQVNQKIAIKHNFITTPRATKSNITLRAETNDGTTDFDSFWTIISDNKLIATTAWPIQLESTNDTAIDERGYEYLIERNWIVLGAVASSTGVTTGHSRVTIRNNLMDFSSAISGSAVAVAFNHRDTMLEADLPPIPDYARVYNNTIYGGPNVTGSFRGVYLTPGVTGGWPGGVTNTRVYNNLSYFPNVTAPASMEPVNVAAASYNGPVTGTLQSNNSLTTPSNGNGTAIDPLFDSEEAGADPISFCIDAESYAADGGTSVPIAYEADFFGKVDKTGAIRIGAFVPAANARGTGAILGVGIPGATPR